MIHVSRFKTILAMAGLAAALLSPVNAAPRDSTRDAVRAHDGHKHGSEPRRRAGKHNNIPFPELRLSRERLDGEDAVREAGSQLKDIAEWYGVEPDELKRMLRHDRRVKLDRRGRVFYVEEIPTLAEFEAGSNLYEAPAGEQDTNAVTGAAEVENASAIDLTQTFKLHSRPGARRTIYLDFRSPAVSGTAWNKNYGVTTITPAVFDIDNIPGSLSNTELTYIQNIWKIVAEDYAPFEIDVTTETPPAAALARSGSTDLNFGTRVVITKDWTKQTSKPCGCGGFAYVGAFDDSVEKYKPAWVFFDNLNKNYKYIAEAISHEVGHNLGLHHDGQTKSNGSTLSYYMGHGTSPMSWGPIMGAAYYPVISQWSRGEYAGANQKEDDLSVMKQFGAPMLADDVGNTLATALPGVFQDFGESSRYFTKSGLISTAADVDWFRFELPKGTLNLEVRPSEFAANLDVLVRLFDSTGRELVSANPERSLDAALGPVELNAGVYFLSVDGVGMQDAAGGYSDYGSLGPYAISAVVDVADEVRPLAVLTLSASSGPAPLLVNFSSTGSSAPDGLALTYEWDFGDGIRQTGAAGTTSHTYTMAGTYFPSLTVRDAQNRTDVANATVIVTNPPAPVINVSATPASGVAPLPVKLIGNATAATGVSIASYRWSFGDGTANASTAVVSHVYEKPGMYTAVLSVVDSTGLTTTKSVSINVAAPPPPVVSASSSRVSVAAGANITFQSYATTPLANKTFAYLWDFGDGTPGAVGASVQHAYAKPGQYVARVQATDVAGGVGYATVNVNVVAPAKPTLSVKISSSAGYAPLKVSFTSTATTTAPIKTLTYSWDFGDGSPVEAIQNPSHTYAIPGLYTAVATVTDYLGSSTIAKLTVTVKQPPTLGISLSPSVVSGMAPYPVAFRVTPTNLLPGALVSYQWNFGDGSSVLNTTSTSTARTFTQPGQYTVTVRASDSMGRVATAQMLVKVSAPPPPTVMLSVSSSTIKSGALLKFAVFAYTSSANKTLNFAWDFGDGSNVNGGKTVSHSYATPGSYLPKVTVTDAFGGSQTKQVKITVLP